MASVVKICGLGNHKLSFCKKTGLFKCYKLIKKAKKNWNVILDPLLLGKIKFLGLCLIGRAEDLSRGVLSVLNESIQVDSQCHNTSLRVSPNAQTTYRQTSARSRPCGTTIKIPRPSGILSFLCTKQSEKFWKVSFELWYWRFYKLFQFW
jgi:hypothetical protein